MFVIDGDLTMLQLSVYRASSGVQAIMSSNAKNLAEQDESMVVASGIPYTIVRTGVLTNDRGGKPGFSFEKVFSWSIFSLKTQKVILEIGLMLQITGLYNKWES